MRGEMAVQKFIFLQLKYLVKNNMNDEQSMRLERILTIAIVIIMTIAIGFALYMLKVILIPFIVAILLAYLFSPIIEKLATKFKVPRSISIVVLFVLIFISVSWLWGFLAENIKEFASDWPILQKELENNLDKLASTTNLNRDYILQGLGDVLKDLPLGQSVSALIVFLGNTLFTLLFMVFILFSAHTIPEKLYQAFPKEKADSLSGIIKKINKQVQKYLVIKTVISVLTGLSVYLVLLLLGVKFAFLWSVIAFFLNYIPNIGSIIAGVPPILTAFLQFGAVKALVVFLAFVVIQFFWGNIIEPLVIGKRLNLSPIVVLLALLFWGWLWGIVGAIIAVPLMAIIKISFSNIPGLKPIAVLMSEK
jgi:predicted PurR-regulated permease PerM